MLQWVPKLICKQAPQGGVRLRPEEAVGLALANASASRPGYGRLVVGLAVSGGRENLHENRPGPKLRLGWQLLKK